jgi:hypothetical protein
MLVCTRWKDEAQCATMELLESHLVNDWKEGDACSDALVKYTTSDPIGT